MDTRVQGFGGFRIDIALSHDAPERRLNVTAGTTEAVVQLEMPEGRVEVVAPQQADDALAQPDAFGSRGRTLQGAARLDGLVRPRLPLGPDRIVRLAALGRLRLRRLRGRLRRRGLLGRLLLLGLDGHRGEAERKEENRCGDGNGEDARTREVHDGAVVSGRDRP